MALENEGTTILFPDMSLFDGIIDDDFRDKPASSWSVIKIGTLQAKLEQYLSTRRNRRFQNTSTELPLHRLLSIANESFGHDGWSSELIDISILEYNIQINDENESHCLQVESTVRITLKDETYHEATGHGRADNLPNKFMAFQKAKKSAVTDATKKAIYGLKSIILDHESKLRSGYYEHDITVFN